MLRCNMLVATSALRVELRIYRALLCLRHNGTQRDLRTMECTINWMPGTGMGFVAETGSGHFLTMDGAPDGGGRNLAPRPMETVLAGTGACTAYDVVLILKRGRHPAACPHALADARRGQAHDHHRAPDLAGFSCRRPRNWC